MHMHTHTHTHAHTHTHTTCTELLPLPVLQILERPRYACIEKIKAIGHTYMAAAGLGGDNGVSLVQETTLCNRLFETPNIIHLSVQQLHSVRCGTVEPVYSGHCIRQPPLYNSQPPWPQIALT